MKINLQAPLLFCLVFEADEVKKILTLANNKPLQLYLPKESRIELKHMSEAITRIQHTVDNLKQKQTSPIANQLPYAGSGFFFGVTSPHGKLSRQQH